MVFVPYHLFDRLSVRLSVRLSDRLSVRLSDHLSDRRRPTPLSLPPPPTPKGVGEWGNGRAGLVTENVP